VYWFSHRQLEELFAGAHPFARRDGGAQELSSDICAYRHASSGQRTRRSATLQPRQPGGARTYFSLPKFGTPYLPGFESDLAFRADRPDRGGWAPVPLETYVEYRDLTVTERVDNIAPDLVTPGHLAWVSGTATSIRPFGSIVDTAVEAQSQRSLFLTGALFGVLGGFVPALIGGIGRSSVDLGRHFRRRASPGGRPPPGDASPTGWPAPPV
jgi:hypothetical protein